jgi:hypothetical protein
MRPLFEATIAHMTSLQHGYALRPRSPVPPVISGQTEVARPPGDIRLSEVVVLTGALTESEWDKVRAFVRRTSRESLRLRLVRRPILPTITRSNASSTSRAEAGR